MPIPVFDLDGTLVDSDEALTAAFVALGIPAESVTFGHVLADECRRLGVAVADYLAAYDTTTVRPFAGVDALLAVLNRWAVCSNKHRASGRAELDRLGWRPAVASFAEDFDGPKRLGPVVERLGVDLDQVAFIGDTDHDRRLAADAGVPFALAGWNPRARAQPGDTVLAHPGEVTGWLAHLTRR